MGREEGLVQEGEGDRVGEGECLFRVRLNSLKIKMHYLQTQTLSVIKKNTSQLTDGCLQDLLNFLPEQEALTDRDNYVPRSFNLRHQAEKPGVGGRSFNRKWTQGVQDQNQIVNAFYEDRALFIQNIKKQLGSLDYSSKRRALLNLQVIVRSFGKLDQIEQIFDTIKDCHFFNDRMIQPQLMSFLKSCSRIWGRDFINRMSQNFGQRDRQKFVDIVFDKRFSYDEIFASQEFGSEWLESYYSMHQNFKSAQLDKIKKKLNQPTFHIRDLRFLTQALKATFQQARPELVSKAVGLLGSLAKIFGKTFYPFARKLFSQVALKFKQKDPQLKSCVLQSLISFESCLSREEIGEKVQKLLNDKNNELRVGVLQFVARVLQGQSKEQQKDEKSVIFLKRSLQIAKKLQQDCFKEVRQQASLLKIQIQALLPPSNSLEIVKARTRLQPLLAQEPLTDRSVAHNCEGSEFIQSYIRILNKNGVSLLLLNNLDNQNLQWRVKAYRGLKGLQLTSRNFKLLIRVLKKKSGQWNESEPEILEQLQTFLLKFSGFLQQFDLEILSPYLLKRMKFIQSQQFIRSFLSQLSRTLNSEDLFKSLLQTAKSYGDSGLLGEVVKFLIKGMQEGHEQWSKVNELKYFSIELAKQKTIPKSKALSLIKKINQLNAQAYANYPQILAMLQLKASRRVIFTHFKDEEVMTPSFDRHRETLLASDKEKERDEKDSRVSKERTEGNERFASKFMQKVQKINNTVQFKYKLQQLEQLCKFVEDNKKAFLSSAEQIFRRLRIKIKDINKLTSKSTLMVLISLLNIFSDRLKQHFSRIIEPLLEVLSDSFLKEQCLKLLTQLKTNFGGIFFKQHISKYLNSQSSEIKVQVMKFIRKSEFQLQDQDLKQLKILTRSKSKLVAEQASSILRSVGRPEKEEPREQESQKTQYIQLLDITQKEQQSQSQPSCPSTEVKASCNNLKLFIIEEKDTQNIPSSLQSPTGALSSKYPQLSQLDIVQFSLRLQTFPLPQRIHQLKLLLDFVLTRTRGVANMYVLGQTARFFQRAFESFYASFDELQSQFLETIREYLYWCSQASLLPLTNLIDSISSKLNPEFILKKIIQFLQVPEKRVYSLRDVLQDSIFPRFVTAGFLKSISSLECLSALSQIQGLREDSQFVSEINDKFSPKLIKKTKFKCLPNTADLQKSSKIQIPPIKFDNHPSDNQSNQVMTHSLPQDTDTRLMLQCLKLPLDLALLHARLNLLLQQVDSRMQSEEDKGLLLQALNDFFHREKQFQQAHKIDFMVFLRSALLTQGFLASDLITIKNFLALLFTLLIRQDSLCHLKHDRSKLVNLTNGIVLNLLQTVKCDTLVVSLLSLISQFKEENFSKGVQLGAKCLQRILNRVSQELSQEGLVESLRIMGNYLKGCSSSRQVQIITFKKLLKRVCQIVENQIFAFLIKAGIGQQHPLVLLVQRLGYVCETDIQQIKSSLQNQLKQILTNIVRTGTPSDFKNLIQFKSQNKLFSIRQFMKNRQYSEDLTICVQSFGNNPKSRNREYMRLSEQVLRSLLEKEIVLVGHLSRQRFKKNKQN